ncbi:MAG TPA: malonyl-CoA synthase [Burkholderiales bacterium]|nr:malonyl-CoA synthase [Burkholderiales bacterium]
MANANAYAAFERSFAINAARAALEVDTGDSCTYSELDRETGRCASALCSFGLQRGDRVAVQVEKSPQSLFLYLACLRAGLVYLPLNTAYRLAEMTYFLSDAEPALVVCSPSAEEGIRQRVRASGVRAQVATLDASGGGSLSAAVGEASGQFATAIVAPEQLAVIIYTSGTTGRSKGAMLTHRNLVSNAVVLVDSWGFSHRDVLLHVLPIFHVHGLFVANHCALLSGARLLWRAKFDAVATLSDLSRATVMMGVPTHYSRLLAEPGLTREACAHMRLFISGSAPLSSDTFRAFRARTGHAILERYGMSEAGMITSNPLLGERREGTVGFPLRGVSVRVVDQLDQPTPAGEPGAIQIRGDNVFAGYWRNPSKTQEEFTTDGWFRTGDIGVIDGDGCLSIVGRAKDLIITGGYNVYPREVELVIDAMPGVRESAVVGVPHPDFGEAVTAVIVVERGCEPLSESAVIEHVKRHLANYKVPKRVYFFPDLPRNAMGKVQKNLLRQQLAAALRAS